MIMSNLPAGQKQKTEEADDLSLNKNKFCKENNLINFLTSRSLLSDYLAVTQHSSSSQLSRIFTKGRSTQPIYQNENSIEQKAQVHVSEFMAQEISQKKTETQQNQNQKLLRNINQIIQCKKQAEQIMQQFHSYRNLIAKLKNQNKYYQEVKCNQQREARQLRDMLHIRQLQMMQLKQEKDRMTRMYNLQCAKVRVLRQMHNEAQTEKWKQMVMNRFGDNQNTERVSQQSDSMQMSFTLTNERMAFSNKANQKTRKSKQQYRSNIKKTPMVQQRSKKNVNPQMLMNQRSDQTKNMRSTESVNIGHFLKEHNFDQYGKIVKSGEIKQRKVRIKQWEDESTII